MSKCRYSAIKDFDINQSDNISVSLWMQGCEHKCEGSYNQETWDFDKGYEFTYETIENIINLLTKHPQIHKNLSILGGETLSFNKIDKLTELVKRVKNINNEIQVWIWTGYLFEDVKDLELMNYIDILVDGKYIKSLHNPTRYKGSDNQRIINVQKSLKQNEVVLY